MRALILANDCNPDWPSLPVVAYNFARALSERMDTVVVTQIRNQPNITRAGGLGKAEVVYIDSEWIAAPLHQLATFLRRGQEVGWTIQMAMSYPSYLAFEWMVWRQFKEELEQREFDIVHRITPMSPTLPSLIAHLSPVPFVLGPLNGNLAWPKQFKGEQKREKELLSNLRNAYKFLPFYRSTYNSAAKILAAFEHTVDDLSDRVKGKTIEFPEVGINPDLFNSIRRTPSDRLTILFAGRLVPYKLPVVVVQAFANSPLLRQHRLVIVGDGPERPHLEMLIEQHNLHDCVELRGKVSQGEVSQLMQSSDIFAFPSIRELGAGVVIEAMACALACVVVDYGGPGTLVAPDRGVKVALDTLKNLVCSFQEELENLVASPKRIQSLGQAAQEHALQNYTWEAKADKVLKIYQSLIQQEEVINLEKTAYV